ncbi:hypothetical protein FEM03_22420 [Phragmitibacter flavus]|uniref:SLA1 homology domain-containing protein n=1 Tax=Phragmitibacter flavus TaxID=2576071 RepID=A0A5R8K822_9BACT|nr:hypothetical protein [Phragmitibacter flavus]TLD68463.1 hypothetical protein FEM03_22420 [Phragmitibacter flavus]
MRCVLQLLVLLLSLCVEPGGAQAQAQKATEARTWTNSEGRTMQARLVRREAENLTFLLQNGQHATLTISQLSAVDQHFVRINFPTTVAAKWPDVVEVSNRALDVKAVEEDLAKRSYIYRSEFFQFTAQDKLAVSVMKEIARTFESAHALVSALPWSIDPSPPADLGFYQAKFYLNRRNYILDGGPENSGGVYFTGDRIFRIPFDSLGLEMRGKTWFKNDSYRNDTLVHEITHQMMHDFLPFLPMWIIEGSAEYTEMIPYNAGKFLAGAHQRGIKEYVRDFQENRGISFSDATNLAANMTVTHDQWNERSRVSSGGQARLYHASAILVYYFCHLDGDGTGTRFIDYMKSIGKARDAWAAFFKNPAVKRNADGNFSYPSTLPLPEQPRDETYGFSQLSILLNGRTPEQLEEDIREAYRKIGIR